MPDDLTALLETLVLKFGTQQALAEACGMTPSGFWRGAQNGTLEVPSLLRLAKVGGLSPLAVLRAAGKPDVAELLEEFFGAGARAPTLSRPDREVLALWNALTTQQRNNHLELLRLQVERNKEARSATATAGRRRRQGRRTA